MDMFAPDDNDLASQGDCRKPAVQWRRGLNITADDFVKVINRCILYDGFGAASVNVQRQQKTIEAFNRLPEEFTTDDVMRCFRLNGESSARSRVRRLVNDHLVEKIREEKENGTTKAIFKKTGVTML